MKVLLILAIGTFFMIMCSFIASIIAFVVSQSNPSSPAPAPWHKAPKSSAPAETSESIEAFFNQGKTPGPSINCQNLSNSQLSYPDHRGKATLQDWSDYKIQGCSTKPTAYTRNNQLFSEYYSTLGLGPPTNDPALTEKQSIKNDGSHVIENVVAGKKLGFSTNGELSLGNQWKTPAGPIDTYTLKFDSNTFNAGNLCVFNKAGNIQWCMLPQVAVQSNANSTTGRVDLSTIQQGQLSAGNMKNNSDAAPRFVMIDDTGNFCMYRGSPGSTQGSAIVCK
jgi:hypothetical protein